MVTKTKKAERLLYREEWLAEAVKALAPLFEEAGVKVPDVRVSIGWPSGRGTKRTTIGQCWMPEAVEDSVPAIFISPTLKHPVEVLDTLIHELVHACGRRGHKREFASLAGEVGMVKPWPSSSAGPELEQRLFNLAIKLGPFDHGKIKREPSRVVQSTRMVKVACGDCGYTVRVTRKWIEVGLPICPVDQETMEVAGPLP